MLTSGSVAIEAQELAKCYRVFTSPRARLAQGLWPGKRKFYQSFWALQNLSFRLEKGKTMGVIGRNGSGKSTLLQLLCGTLTPTQGHVCCSGRIAALLELGSGFNPDFTGLENVRLNASLLGLSKAEIDQKLDAILSFADIGDFIYQPVKTYSSGMALRLAFAVQANIEPDVLVVDEALAVGDELFQRKCFKHLDSLKKNGTSILLVTHNCAQIVQHCDEAMLLHQGQLACIGKPKLVTTVYQRLINNTAPDWHEQAKALFEQLESQARSESSIEQAASAHDNALASSWFDPKLQPENPTIYPSNGLRIESVYIENEQGEPCNLLPQGAPFTVRIRYCADEDLENLQLACSLATKSGQVITGQRFPELGSGLEPVTTGQVFSCSFRFRGGLLPDIYFINAGAWNSPDRRYLHRIVDAAVVRILPPESMSYSFGLVDLAETSPQLN